jgi:hypothetical protein
MWLVQAAQPKTIVELGTHNGFSFFAFCEAVKKYGVETHCTAIDTWEGDEHAGSYSESVFRSVVRQNTNYENFTSLKRMTFAEALSGIADASIDILHIDGRHFYEDVKEDFESWLPKVSSTGIVLFHDTNVWERDFGVHRLWSEIKDRFDTIEFPYQHGLGVCFVGGNSTKAIEKFRGMASDQREADKIVDVFQAEGGALVEDYVLARDSWPKRFTARSFDFLSESRLPLGAWLRRKCTRRAAQIRGFARPRWLEEPSA